MTFNLCLSMHNHWNLVCYKQAVFIEGECGLCRSTWPRFSHSDHLGSAIVISSVDFQLFLLNFRSLKISYILSLAKEKANELKRGPRVFGLWGLMPSVEMEGVASVRYADVFHLSWVTNPHCLVLTSPIGSTSQLSIFITCFHTKLTYWILDRCYGLSGN